MNIKHTRILDNMPQQLHLQMLLPPIHITLLFICFINLLCLATTTPTTDVKLDNKLLSAWQQWSTVEKKQYKTLEEETERRTIWVQNLARIQQHNSRYDAGLESYRLGLNKHADLTDDEFRNRFTASRPHHQQSRKRQTSPLNLKAQKQFLTKLSKAKAFPLFVDWRKKGLVTAVKDQGSCGSCYAFSTTGALEGQMAKKTGSLRSFSEQQLIDCSVPFGDDGCSGGIMDYGFDYIQMFGITTEDNYPYMAKQQTCNYIKNDSVAWVSGYVDLPKGDTFALHFAVATQGPVSVALDVEANFRFYKSGIFNSNLCSNDEKYLNHAVLVVGYGVDRISFSDYWIVKNSWSDTWGEEGYVRFARTTPSNLCGIADHAVMPLV